LIGKGPWFELELDAFLLFIAERVEINQLGCLRLRDNELHAVGKHQEVAGGGQRKKGR
jgi:hypothetical protein